MSLVPSLIGFAVFFGGIYWGWSNKAQYWRELATAYADRHAPAARARLSMQTLFLFCKGKLNFFSHTSIVSVGVTDTGLSLSLMPVFSWMHAPLHIPFVELAASPTNLYFNSSSFELNGARAPRISLVISGELLDWISEHAPAWQSYGPSTSALEGHARQAP